MTERRTALRLPRVPGHVVVMLSAATAGYAAALAGVAALQAADEAALMSQRSPALQDIDGLTAAHDHLVARLEGARRDYAEAADAYARAAALQDAIDRRLAELAATVAEIDGVARRLPTSVRIPVRQTVVQVKTPPATQATTGASGG